VTRNGFHTLPSLSSISSVQNALEILQDPDITQRLERARMLRAPDETIDSGEPFGGTGEKAIGGALDQEPGVSGSDRFRILRPYARGGLGIVSIANDTELNREVALKEIQADFADDGASRSRFLVEAEVTRAVPSEILLSRMNQLSIIIAPKLMKPWR
jgi:hypothetical protein